MSTSSKNRHEGGAAGFDAIIGQQRPAGMLAAALQKNEVPHAMLFTGEAGVGKKTTAGCFAMAANCKQPAPGRDGFPNAASSINPCGRCGPCRKIDSGNHPDFHYIKPSGTQIKIDQVRFLCSALALKPNEASLRIVLISDAHLMNAEAGNAMLKVLEEPPENTVFILTAPEAADILPTIVSRCRQIRFNPIPEDQIEAYLVKHGNMAPENAMVVAALANGSIGRALAIKDDQWVIRHRKWIIDRMEILLRKASGHDLYFAEALAKDREKLVLGLEIMKSWLRDIAVSKVFPDRIGNRDLKATIKALSEQINMDALIEKTYAVWQAERAIKANANIRLAVEAMVLKLSDSR